jgi:hypothetical protein
MAFAQSVAELLRWLFDDVSRIAIRLLSNTIPFILKSLYRSLRFIYSEGIFFGGTSVIQHIICNPPQPMDYNNSVK